MGVSGTTPGRRATLALSARLTRRVALEVHANGDVIAFSDGYSLALGTFGADAADHARKLHLGVPLEALEPDRSGGRNEVDLLVRRLAGHGLLEYRLGHPRDGPDLVVIEPQVPAYRPHAPALGNADTLVLSRFAYMRRRGDAMVLESPRADASFRLCDPTLAAVVAMLAAPQPVKRLRRLDGFPGVAFLALLVHGDVVCKVGEDGFCPREGGHDLALWEFHDLLFHARSTEGRHADPVGGVYPHAGLRPPLPAVRPRWPGESIDLRAFSAPPREPVSPLARLLQDRRSTRSFDDRRPITIAELAHFLEATARVRATHSDPAGPAGGAAAETRTERPYPSAGASYGLELYLAVDRCEGLARGFYHYDAGIHALVPIDVPAQELDTQLMRAGYAMGTSGMPQILVTLAARFGRTSWKYSSIAYALVLKDVGVLTQTFYLQATAQGLGGCAIGVANIDLFARMTGIAFHVEGPVGQFAIGRSAEAGASG